MTEKNREKISTEVLKNECCCFCCEFQQLIFRSSLCDLVGVRECVAKNSIFDQRDGTHETSGTGAATYAKIFRG